MKPILVIRLSSLGDVALTVPVFRTLESELPEQQFILVSRPEFSDLFVNLANVRFFPADISGRNDGLTGMLRLYRQLVNLEFDEVIDLHNVFRSNLLTSSFKLKGKAVSVYDKMRPAKNAFIADPSRSAGVPHTAGLYLSAFDHLKPGMELTPGPYLFPKSASLPEGCNICTAPFSRHTSKEWPHDHMTALIGKLMRENIRVHCAAFSDREQVIAKSWQNNYPDLVIMDHTLTLGEQLGQLRAMDLVVSMDSANLHLAGLVGTPVVSIWGPTHPALGFGPLDGNSEIIQPPGSFAGRRPLSRYGRFGSERDLADAAEAMASISPKTVFDRVMQMLEKSKV